MHRDLRDQVENLEDTILFFVNSDLPQVASEEDVIIDLIHDCTGKSLNLVDAEFHHQVGYC